MSAVPISISSAVDEIRALLGDRLSTSTGVRDHHSKDESWHTPHRPGRGGVSEQHRRSRGDRADLRAPRTPVVAYGTGTSLEGNVIPEHGGVVVDLANMNKVLRVNAEDLDVTVQARVTRKQLNEHSSATRACSSRSIRAPTHRSAAWRRRAPPAPTPCATARCARTCWR